MSYEESRRLEQWGAKLKSDHADLKRIYDELRRRAEALSQRKKEVDSELRSLNLRSMSAMDSCSANVRAMKSDRARLLEDIKNFGQKLDEYNAEVQQRIDAQYRINEALSSSENTVETDGHRGGFSTSAHGWISEHAVTFSLGWGTKEGHTLIADGHMDDELFRKSTNHDHYGPGDGPNNNGSLRRKYLGPDA